MTECTLLPRGVPYEYPLANADPGLKRLAMGGGARGKLSLAVTLLITWWRTSNGVRPPESA
jgi:hypothetical protein